MPVENTAGTPAPAAPAAEPQVNLETPFSSAAAAATQATPATPGATSGAGATPAAPVSTPDFTQSEYYSQAKSLGIPLDGITDEKALLKAAIAAYQVERPYAQHARASLSQPQVKPDREVDDHVANTKGDQVPGEDVFDPDKHFGSLWSAPKLDDAAKHLIEYGIVQLGEDGLYQAKPGYEAMALPVLNSLNQAHVAQKQQLAKFFEGNPYEAIYKAILPAIRHEMSRDFQELSTESLQTYEQQAYADKWESDNSKWLFTNDAAGNRMLTPDGQKFADQVAVLKAKGISDPQTLSEWGLKLAGINTNAGAAAGTVTQPVAGIPAPNTERPRGPDGKFLPATAATVPVEKPTTQQSFLEKAKERASASPNGGGYSPSTPVVANQGDLETMFTTAWRQAAVV